MKEIKSRIGYFILLFSFLGNIFLVDSPLSAQPIIARSNPSETTDTLKSGELVIGITKNAGGVINYLHIPGTGNIFGPSSVLYGRSGQSAMRDAMHGGRYNPTQAGFWEEYGTPCIVEKTEDALILPARNLALWHGDCEWDYIEWENLAPDPPCYDADNGHGDVDQIDESALEGKQDTEVRSEFDFFGKYIDYRGKGGIEISCIRHYFEYRFIRKPGHCLNQFRPGLDIFKEEGRHNDISEKYPSGNHTAEDFDMSNFIISWHLRNDKYKWDPAYRFVKNSDGSWNVNVKSRTGPYIEETWNGTGVPTVPRFYALSNSSDPDSPNALGVYLPPSEFNRHETIGVDENTGLISYKDCRYQSITNWDQPERIPTMTLYGFKMRTNGILNRNRLDENIYEAFRYDVYIFLGSPNEIWKTIQKLEKKVLHWNFYEDPEGWSGTSGMSYSPDDSSLSLDLSETGQILISPDSLLIDADLQKFLAFSLKNQSPNNTLTLKFKRYGSEEKFSLSIDIIPNATDDKNYTINLSEYPEWKGMIRNLEIHLNETGGQAIIGFIAINADGLSDCSGVFNGEAYIDDCGNCVGGTTGKSPCQKFDCMGVENGSAYLNDCGDCVGGTSDITETTRWEFNSLDKWNLNDRLSGKVQDGTAELTVTGNDPFMNYTGNVCINSKKRKILKLSVKNNTNGNQAALYFKNDITNAWKFHTIQISANESEIKNYLVDLSGNSNWEGNVYEIRFDPPGNSGTFYMDYMEISDNNFPVSQSSDPSVNDFTIYPNPANDFVKVYSSFPTRAEVLNLDGKKMMESGRFAGETILNINHLKAGLYIIKLMNDKGEVNKKLVVR